jgi:hypothetical protein
VSPFGVIVLNIAYIVGAFTATLFTAPILSLLGIRGTARKQPGSVPVSVS